MEAIVDGGQAGLSCKRVERSRLLAISKAKVETLNVLERSQVLSQQLERFQRGLKRIEAEIGAEAANRLRGIATGIRAYIEYYDPPFISEARGDVFQNPYLTDIDRAIAAKVHAFERPTVKFLPETLVTLLAKEPRLQNSTDCLANHLLLPFQRTFRNIRC